MDKEKKKELNKAIEVLKNLCRNSDCNKCPMYKDNCYGYEGRCEIPDIWEPIA